MGFQNVWEVGVLEGLVLIVLLSIIYYVGSAIYCLYFHPLSKYPGPFSARFSLWLSYYYSARGDRHIWIWQCHETYGPVFRSGPNSLIFNTPKAYRDIFEGKANVKKGIFYKTYCRKAGDVSTWTANDPVTHARKRRILNAAFSDKALRTSEPYIIQHVDRWCEVLQDGAGDDWSSPKNMTEWSDYLVFDILGELCYAKSFRMKEPEHNALRSVPKFMCDHTIFLNHLNLLALKVVRGPWNPLWLWLKPRGLDRAMEIFAPKNVIAYMRFVESNLVSRIAQENNGGEKDGRPTDAREDMFHHIFHARDPETGGPGYKMEELFEETNLLVIAGSDTTSTVIPAMFFYLTRHPEVYQRLTSEIRTTFGSADEIHAGPKLASCRYLRAFIDETMRMNPPVGGDQQREVLAGGITIDGRYIPRGTNVCISIYSLHHNEDTFPDSFRFDPERWIGDEQTKTAPASIAASMSGFAPFSSGPRGCPGKNLAYLEMSITMAKALYLCEVRALAGNDLGAGKPGLMWGRENKKHFQTWDVFVSLRQGPVVQFKGRNA
ncbi:MAG: hypothetical protein Q9224_005463 [Gallowayella concinna]